jgi:hypothetical protein
VAFGALHRMAQEHHVARRFSGAETGVGASADAGAGG